MDLTVRTEGVARVLREYGPIEFVSLSNDDPIIKSQNASSLESKGAHGYAQIHTKYLQMYSKHCHFAEVLKYEMSNYTKHWFDENMENLESTSWSLGLRVLILAIQVLNA